jgi:acyl-CoA synthetase (AMP-forming)/AMP-acid ligase II
MSHSPIYALQSHAVHRPSDTAFWFGDDVWTYGRWASEAERLARGLVRAGVKKGDRVALHMFNRPEMLVAYAGCFQLGLTAAPLRTAYKAAELLPLLDRLQPAIYIGEAALYSNVANADASILPFDRSFVVDRTGDDGRVKHWEVLLDEPGKGVPVVFDADTPAVLVSTSGTTGTPKLVIHTYATLSAAAAFVGGNLFRPSDIGMGQLAFAHMAGLVTSLSYLQLGVPFVVLRTFDVDAVLDAIDRYKCTVLVGLPSIYAALLDAQVVDAKLIDADGTEVTKGEIGEETAQQIDC